MPVTKSAKRALRVAHRRASENVRTRSSYKRAVKAVRKAAESGAKETATLLQKAQSALDKAAKSNTIHRNKASRLKARLAKKLSAGASTATKTVKKAAKKAAPKKKAKK